MTEYMITDRHRIGDNFVAVLSGVGLVHLGDILKFPDGKSVTVIGIGKKYTYDGEMEIYFSGECDFNQNKLYAQ